MTPEIEQELRRLYTKYCKGNFYKCFTRGGFTSIGDEDGIHITFLQAHSSHNMCIDYPGYRNNWHSVRNESDMDKVFENCINEAKKIN